jgi:hypothetical protein
LVADVPDELVAWRVKGVVKRDRQLDDTQPGADVAASAGTDVDEPSAQIGGERWKLAAGHGAQIGWRLDSIEEAHAQQGSTTGASKADPPLALLASG